MGTAPFLNRELRIETEENFKRSVPEVWVPSSVEQTAEVYETA
jgi:hypothetical protein